MIYDHLRIQWLGQALPTADQVDTVAGIQQLKPDLAQAVLLALAGMYWIPVQPGAGIQTPDLQTYSALSPQSYQQIAGLPQIPLGFPATIGATEFIIVDAGAINLPNNQPVLNEMAVLVARSPEAAVIAAPAGGRFAIAQPLQQVGPGVTPTPAAPARRRRGGLVAAAIIGGLGLLALAAASS